MTLCVLAFSGNAIGALSLWRICLFSFFLKMGRAFRERKSFFYFKKTNTIWRPPHLYFGSKTMRTARFRQVRVHPFNLIRSPQGFQRGGPPSQRLFDSGSDSLTLNAKRRTPQAPHRHCFLPEVRFAALQNFPEHVVSAHVLEKCQHINVLAGRCFQEVAKQWCSLLGGCRVW